jgi:hypothetical protein
MVSMRACEQLTMPLLLSQMGEGLMMLVDEHATREKLRT